MANPGMRLTRRGLNLCADAQVGKLIHFTRLALGDGEFDYKTESVLDLEDIKSHKMDLPIVELRRLGDGTAVIVGWLSNIDNPEGFYARENAIYAQDPDTGEEFLYAYGNVGEEFSFIPAGTAPVKINVRHSFETIIRNAENVTATIDLTFAYVGQDEYQAHVDSEHPHPNTPNHYDDIYQSDAIWATDADAHLHKMTLPNFRSALFGSTDDLSDVGKRISDNEKKTNELDIFVKARNELGLDANLLVVEDFQSPNTIDFTKVKVTSCAQFGNLIGTENHNGLRAGAFYWISDGVQQELVKVAAIVYNYSSYHVKIDGLLDNNYNLSNAYLYRTTAEVKDAKLRGLTEQKRLEWIPAESFKGIEANVARNLPLKTNLNNAAAFDISGDGLLTADDYFTLTA